MIEGSLNCSFLNTGRASASSSFAYRAFSAGSTLVVAAEAIFGRPAVSPAAIAPRNTSRRVVFIHLLLLRDCGRHRSGLPGQSLQNQPEINLKSNAEN